VVDGGVILDLTQPEERRTYENLVADVVFFTAMEAFEAGEAVRWARRTEVTVVSSEGEFAGSVLGSAGPGSFLFP
jgi:hypothetical protein